MKLFAFIALITTAFAGYNVAVDADHVVTVQITGEQAKELYNNLDVKPVPTLTEGSYYPVVKEGYHLTCSLVVQKKGLKGLFENASFKAKYKKWLECASSIGSADPKAIEKACGPQPVKPTSKKLYKCQMKIDSSGTVL